MNNNNKVVAISEEQINKMILNNSDYCAKVKIIFNKLTDLFEEIQTYYKCSSSDKLSSKCALLTSNFNIIVSNLTSYNNDLLLIKRKYAQNMEDISLKIKKDVSKIETKENYTERR